MSFFQSEPQQLPNSSNIVQENGNADSILRSEPASGRLPIAKSADRGQFVYFVSQHMKDVLLQEIFSREEMTNAIIYVKTNFNADNLAEKLNRAGITAESFHENKSQRTKVKNLSNFKRNFTRILVATESAASAVEINEVCMLVNYDLPFSAETYTERLTHHCNVAGISPKAISLCDESEKNRLKNINRVLVNKIKILEHHFAA